MPTVFIVDSDLARADLMTQLLRDAGFHTLSMTDASMTMAVLNAIRADLFMVDLSRPQTQGAELIERLRRDEQWADVPSIATGARAAETIVLRGKLGIGEVFTDREASPGAVLDGVRRFTAAKWITPAHEQLGAFGART